MKQIIINVQSSGTHQRIIVPRELQPLRLSEVLRKSTLSMNTRCGGRGLCDGCLVQLSTGVLRHRVTGQHAAPAQEMIRSCEYQLDSQDVTITIPARSLVAYEPQVVSNFKINISRASDPIWRSIRVPASATREQMAAILSRELDGAAVALPENLPETSGDSLYIDVECMEDGWRSTGARAEQPVAPLGIAVDIGTTTVALLVTDLADGKVLASAAGFNRQMHLGDDVLTRINLCSTDKAMLERLQFAIVKDTLERLLTRALKDASISDERVACIAIAANTTMLHLFAGVDPTPMGFAPFTAPFLAHKTKAASDVHLHLSSLPSLNGNNGTSSAAADPNVHLLPSAAAYVGADLTAGVVSSGLVYDDGPSLLVDVGTNGEIVLKHNDRLFGTATAAGPAFEGSRMACGMRAGQGAVSHIKMDMTDQGLVINCEVIGNVKPTGICGSAYVDFLAQARKVGVLSPAGRIVAGIADDRVGPFRNYGTSFRIATGHGQEPIVISEADVASLLQAKAAIAAGILTLLRRIGVDSTQIKTLFLAGGFGMHLDIDNTIACGLLPGFARKQVQLVGNTSLAGAYLSLLDVSVLDEIKRVAKAIEMVELNLDPEFEGCYIDQLSLI